MLTAFAAGVLLGLPLAQIAKSIEKGIGDTLGGWCPCWLVAAVLRARVGSATVVGLTTAGLVAPLWQHTHPSPNLLVLAVGAGSLLFSHVNDADFWLFKECINPNVKDTLRSWSGMEVLMGFWCSAY